MIKRLLKGIYKFYKTCRIVTMQWIAEHQEMHWRDVLKHQIRPSKTITIMTLIILTSPHHDVQESTGFDGIFD